MTSRRTPARTKTVSGTHRRSSALMLRKCSHPFIYIYIVTDRQACQSVTLCQSLPPINLQGEPCDGAKADLVVVVVETNHLGEKSKQMTRGFRVHPPSRLPRAMSLSTDGGA